MSHPLNNFDDVSEVTIQRCRTFRYRMHPTSHQTQALLRQLELQCELYNAALEERIWAWGRDRHRVSFFDQVKTLTSLKEVRPDVTACGVTLCRGTLKRLDWAFDGFLRRVRCNKTPGFPRFRSSSRWDSLQWEDRDGWRMIDTGRIRLFGIGEIKINYHRPLAGMPKAITVKREGHKWWLSVRCFDVPAMPLPATGREVGIDLGIVNLVATSDGQLYKGDRVGACQGSAR